jgi:uncharacterized membrane protein YraQ (UPF0718 family)
MNSKFNVKQWLIATGATFVVFSILAFFVQRAVWVHWIPDQSLPQPENIGTLRVWMYLSRALFCAIFVYVFSLGYQGKPGIGEGLRFGLWIGLLTNLPGVFSSMVVTTSSLDFLIARAAVGFVQALLGGLIVGLIYKGQQATTA